jgi:hypothetical protein
VTSVIICYSALISREKLFLFTGVTLAFPSVSEARIFVYGVALLCLTARA